MSSTATPLNSEDAVRTVDDKMNLIEFIKSIDQLKQETIEMERRAAKEEAAKAKLQTNAITSKDSKLTSGLRFLSRKSRESTGADAVSNTSIERKYSAEQHNIKPKPSLRMKAFKNRQDTFHSLVSCCEPAQESVLAVGVNNSSSSSLTEDLMRLPYVQGLGSQPVQTKQKGDSNVHSELLTLNNLAGSKDEPKKRRVLHTMVQPDGSVVGFFTEESNESANDEQVEASGVGKVGSAVKK